ncbi:hypothetical protein [Pedobacter boryungensis]|uniref:DUF3887 domain-containing protein n=1 Tax=Pedobacter boryungensis TaxID=869962 RepID=A0ABX2DE22_9SPHI|nr:hypothetical protein [Pedobacter boryungensis]NQX32342.1 hypothetical protein [Pedobacter boryungensis]
MKSQTLLLKFPIKIFIISELFITIVSACKKDNVKTNDAIYREIAWNYLDTNSKSTIITPYRTAVVGRETYDNQEVVSVRFNTTQDTLLGPIIVYINIKSKKVLGIGSRF